MIKKGSNPRNKTTLFYETFKVQTMKVVLFFLIWGHLDMFLAIYLIFLTKRKKSPIMVQKGSNEKIRPLL